MINPMSFHPATAVTRTQSPLDALLSTDADGNLIRDYVWVDATPVVQIEAGERIAYLHTDHLNTPRLATNAQGVKVWGWEGEACGATQPTGSVTINLRFPGQYFDAESGLHYNWNRYYDPKLCRYISSDPIGLEGGLNTYLYGNANPLRFTDPMGLLSCTYQISTHTLICENNLGQTFMTSAAKAGRDECQDKPACGDTKDKGPLPPGYYPIYPPGYVKKHPDWLFLDRPRGVSNPSNRDQFFIHPWGLSMGCLAIRNGMDLLRRWAAQDNGGDLFVIR